MRRADGGRVLVHVKGNSPPPGMTASAVALTDPGQVYFRRLRRPGIRAYGNLYPKTALAEPHTVNGFGMKIIGDEFIVAFEIVIGDVEEYGGIFPLRALLQDADGNLLTRGRRGKRGD